MTEWVLSVIEAGGYWGIAFLMALENVIPPIPSELIMGLGGIAVARGAMEPLPLIVAGTIGTTAGNHFWYWIGRRFGLAGLKPFVDRWGRWLTIEWAEVEKLYAFFNRHGHWIVFVFRFLPHFRTMISLPAGMMRMGVVRFTLWTFAGAAIWNCVLTGAGYWLGKNFRDLDRFVGPVGIGISVLIVVVWLWRVMTWKPKAER